VTLLSGSNFATNNTIFTGSYPAVGDFHLNPEQWADLPVYRPAWQLIEKWMGVSSSVSPEIWPDQASVQWRIAAGIGCGKTLLIQEIKQKFRHLRLRLLHADFKPKTTVSAAELLERWAQKASRFIELPESHHSADKLLKWIGLAKESLTLQGFCVRFVVEADRLDQSAILTARSLDALWLQRKEFRGISAEQCPVLPPWAEGEINEVLKTMGYEKTLSEEQVASLWQVSRGCPAQVMQQLKQDRFIY
jgi:hypothetical protein